VSSLCRARSSHLSGVPFPARLDYGSDTLSADHDFPLAIGLGITAATHRPSHLRVEYYHAPGIWIWIPVALGALVEYLNQTMMRSEAALAIDKTGCSPSA